MNNIYIVHVYMCDAAYLHEELLCLYSLHFAHKPGT